MDDDFQIITTPDIEIKDENKKKHNKNKLNKISKKKDSLSIDKCQLKPKWNDTIKSDVTKIYDCLDIGKITQKEENKIKHIKSFSVLSKEKILTPGLLDFFRCSDGNREYPSKKYITFAICHHLKKCLIVGSNEGTLCLFKVDGETNDAVCKPMYFERYPIKGGVLLPCGEKVVFFSNRHYFKVLNLTTSIVTHHSIEKPAVIRRMEASPSGGFLVLSTDSSTIQVISTMSFDVIHKIQVSGVVKSMAFSHNGKYLYAFEELGKVSVFEFQENGNPVFRRHWIDYGCIEAVRIAVSSDSQYVACGSPGIVNIYHLSDTWQSHNPSPVKSIDYLETRISQLQFNHAGQMLAIGFSNNSEPIRGSCKLVHLKSMSVYSNFPSGLSATKTRPTSLSFSPGDKYLAVGQFNGKVALYNLKNYDKY